MEYMVNDYDQEINSHQIRIRTLILDGESTKHKDLGLIECRTCFKRTTYTPSGRLQGGDLTLLIMEANLHSQGIDTEWETGSFDNMEEYLSEGTEID